MTLAKQSPESHRRLALALAVFLLYMFYMTAEVNIYLYRSLRTTYYAWVVPVVVTGTLYFFRLKGGREYRLIVCYWLWFVVSRALNHNIALVEDQYLCFDLSLFLPFLALGLVLGEKNRRRFLDWFSAAVGGYYFLIGAAALVCFVLRLQLINPITQWTFGMAKSSGFERVNIMGTNPDSTAYWLLTSLMLMLYQFFACRKKLWRIPIVLSALVDFATIAVTYTRSVRVAVAVILGLLAVMLVYHHVRIRKKQLLILVSVLAFLLAAPLAYKSFDLCADTLSAISDRRAVSETAASASELSARPDARPALLAAEAAEEDPAPQEKQSFRDWLNKVSTKRIEIYECAFLTIRENPSILLRGCLIKDSMTLTNSILQRKMIVPHFHNALLQTLILTGLPGLLLILGFSLLLLIKVFRLLFSRDPQISHAVRVLGLCYLAPQLYGLFEAGLFTDVDVRSLFFYLISGCFLGFYYDLRPKEKKETIRLPGKSGK